MSYKAKNNAYSTLAAGIAAGATSLTVQAGNGDRFPVITAPDWTKITLEDTAGNREVILLGARTAGSDVLGTLTRGQEGTAARAWNAGDVVELRMTAKLVEDAMGHSAQTTGAHAASAIAFSPTGGVGSTTVQGAIAELDSEKQAALGFTPASNTLGNLSNKATARANLGVEAAEVDVASAATTDIGAAASMNVRITGTTTITSLGTVAAGTVRNCRMAGALTLTHNATSLVLPAGGANIATAAGDCFEAESLGSGNWVVRGYQKADGTSVIAAEVTGVVKDYVGATAPSGYVLLSGRTIGSASSGATERANADTSALFTLLWNDMTNTEAPVSGGRGASASADFAANKTITLPDARGRVTAGKDNMGGTTASRLTSAGSGITGTTLGVAGGTETHTLTSAQMPNHYHSMYIGTTGSGSPLFGNPDGGAYSPAGATLDAGGGGAHQNTQPTLVLNKIIKL